MATLSKLVVLRSIRYLCVSAMIGVRELSNVLCFTDIFHPDLVVFYGIATEGQQLDVALLELREHALNLFGYYYY